MAKIAVLSMLSFAASAGAAAAEGKPLITTNVVYGTYDLAYDVYSFAWAKADIDGLMMSYGFYEQVNDVYSSVWAKIPPEAKQAISEAQTKSVQLKALVAEYAEKAYGPTNEMAISAVTKLEAQVPTLSGLIPKTLGNVALFVVYMSLVLYTLLKVFLFVLRVLKCILCCFCCCSLCRRRGGSAEKDGKAKAAGKSKAAANGATNGATNGKAAPAATNGKTATAKAKAKK